MIKLFLFLFYVSQVFASTCPEYSLKGHVRIEKNEMFFVVAEKTQSEAKLSVSPFEQPKLSPYVNHFVKGTFILEAPLKSKVKILELSDVDDATPDPLNQGQENTYKKLKDVKCPQL